MTLMIGGWGKMTIITILIPVIRPDATCDDSQQSSYQPSWGADTQGIMSPHLTGQSQQMSILMDFIASFLNLLKWDMEFIIARI